MISTSGSSDTLLIELTSAQPFTSTLKLGLTQPKTLDSTYGKKDRLPVECIFPFLFPGTPPRVASEIAALLHAAVVPSVQLSAVVDFLCRLRPACRVLHNFSGC